MTIKRGDTVRVKRGGRAAFHLWSGKELVASNAAADLERAAELEVVEEADSDGDIRVSLAEPDTGGMIARDQLQRKFAGDYWEGDKVISSGLHITGVVVDRDPHAEGISRDDKVPVLVETRGVAADPKLRLGEVVYTDPVYLTPAVTRLRPPTFPRVKLDRWFGEIPSGGVVLGGTGGQGGAAIGPGAVGGRGGNGGSAHIHIPAGDHEIRPVRSNHDASPAVDLNANQRAGLLGVEKPVAKPSYIDVTDKVKGSWANVQIGDIVTATHRTQVQGVQVSNARTSEVARSGRGWGDGDVFWCELNLTMHTRYDAHRITKVLRLEKVKLLSERRKPMMLKVTRLVPANHVWGPSYLTAEGEAYVEADQGGTYWVTFVDQKLSGNKLRLKEGRDVVEYLAILGTTRVSGDYEQLVTITHTPA